MEKFDFVTVIPENTNMLRQLFLSLKVYLYEDINHKSFVKHPFS